MNFLNNHSDFFLKNKPLGYKGGRKRPVGSITAVFCRKVAEKVTRSGLILDITLKVDSKGVAYGLDV